MWQNIGWGERELMWSGVGVDFENLAHNHVSPLRGGACLEIAFEVMYLCEGRGAGGVCIVSDVAIT